MTRIVFVTGASGYIGSTVCQQLLEAGFHVRGTARGEKVEHLRQSFTSFSKRFEVIEIADLSRDRVGCGMKDVWALIHLAYYIPRGERPQNMIAGTIEGSMNIIKEAEANGVKHVVVTGSTAAVYNSQGTWKHDDWNPITIEEAISRNNFYDSYCAAKKYSELAIWEWAEAHPDVEVTVVSPPAVYGPWPKDLFLPSPVFPSMIPAIWNLIKPNGRFTSSSGYVDVRDVAKALILAITHSVPTSRIGRKRLVFVSPHAFDWPRSVEILREKRPTLKDRLIKATPSKPVERPYVDFSRIAEVLDMKKEDFYSFEQANSVDNYVELERQWILNGHAVRPPQPFGASIRQQL
ncbi:hypothetical protein VNI00_003879 [Paramarasmius palmivorus]|uniref:NAD-dependent epimerase/dehydratase domain-containing protein n=1 Tax=Paramarasmius palmivorus TaxID=297713 RepID=A0AAW0DRN3_9AGAR